MTLDPNYPKISPTSKLRKEAFKPAKILQNQPHFRTERKLKNFRLTKTK
jgi:hypothetical protein